MPRAQSGSARDLAELIFGYGFVLLVLWTPEFPQLFLAPVALLATLAMVLARRPTRDELGHGQHPITLCRKVVAQFEKYFTADSSHKERARNDKESGIIGLIQLAECQVCLTLLA